MRFRTHVEVQVLIFLLLITVTDASNAALVVLFHFIPSLDFAMKKAAFRPGLHRKLTHNIFILLLAAAAAWAAGYGLIAALAALNFLLHVSMDASGKGVEFFFPASGYRLRLY